MSDARPPVPIHNLSGNAAERSPRHLIILDTETRWEETDAGEVHRLRLWAARLVHRRHPHPRRGTVEDSWGESAGSLAGWIDAMTHHDDSTWVAMHNTAFDLGSTRLPLLMIQRGWSIGDHALTLARPWLRMRNGDRVLTVVDSTSWLPAPLERLGRQLGMVKPDLPDNDDTQAAWLHRCRADVDILAAAMLQLMDWWDNNKLGCWSLTGPSTGWNAYRHRKPRPSVLINPDAEARAFERRAVTGGRRDVWRVGRLPRARYVELDFERAHLTICRHLALPRKRAHWFTGPPSADDWADEGRWGQLAEVTVRSAFPRYTVAIEGRLWHPTGEFRTVLAGPELRDAVARGEVVAWHGGYHYWLAAHMSPWADWLTSVLDDASGATPPMAQVAAKAWSRSVPGKWATRTSRVIDRRLSHVQGWAVERGVHHPGEASLTMLHLNGEQSWYVGDQEADDSFPAVLAWIQSHTRLRLNRLLAALPQSALVSCNTDGLILRARHTPDLDALAELTWPLVPRVKAEYRSIEVLGPNHLIVDGERRMSGVPASAPAVGDLRWSWWTWPGLARQMAVGDVGGYLRERRTVDLSAVPVTRWVLADGSTVPPHAAVSAQGATELLGPGLTPGVPRAAALRRPQHPSLEAALGRDGWAEQGVVA